MATTTYFVLYIDLTWTEISLTNLYSFCQFSTCLLRKTDPQVATALSFPEQKTKVNFHSQFSLFRLYICVKLMFALSIFISYALQYYVPLNILWPHIEVKIIDMTYSRRVIIQYIFRTILVLLSCKLTRLSPRRKITAVWKKFVLCFCLVKWPVILHEIKPRRNIRNEP